MPTDLESRLTDAFDELVACSQVEPIPSFEPVPRRARTVARRWPVQAAAAAIVVAGAGALVWSTQRDQSTGATSTPTPVPTSAAPDMAVQMNTPLRLLPRGLDGFQLQSVSEQPAPQPQGRTWLLLATPHSDGSYTDKLFVQRTARDRVWITAGPNSEVSYETTNEQVDGHDVEVLFDPTNHILTAQYDLGDGTAVQIVDNSPGDDIAAASSRLLNVVAAIEPVGDIDLGIAAPPDTSTVIFHGDPGTTGGPASFLFYVQAVADADTSWSGQTVGLTVTATDDETLPLLAMADSLEPLEIRGQPGYITTHRYPGETNAITTTLIWPEAPGQWVTLTGDNLSLDEMTRLANNLVIVSDHEWGQATGAVTGAPTGSVTTIPGLTEQEIEDLAANS